MSSKEGGEHVARGHGVQAGLQAFGGQEVAGLGPGLVAQAEHDLGLGGVEEAAAVQDLTRLVVEFADQCLLPGAPGRRPGGRGVGHGEQQKHVQAFARAHVGGAGRDHVPVREVAAGGDVHQLQVPQHQEVHVRDGLLVHAQAGQGLPGDPGALFGMAAAQALADVVEQGSQIEAFGVGQLHEDPVPGVVGLGAAPDGQDGLQGVPTHGVDVVHVVLHQVSHPGESRHDGLEHAGVEHLAQGVVASPAGKGVQEKIEADFAALGGPGEAGQGLHAPDHGPPGRQGQGRPQVQGLSENVQDGPGGTGTGRGPRQIPGPRG